MSVRTYNPSVRVGNWNEDIQLQEDTLKDFLARKERGELLIQRSASLNESALGKVELSVSRDGRVHFGDIVTIANAPTDGSRPPTVLSFGGDMVSASTNTETTSRTAFRIISVDGTPDGAALKYEQLFGLATAAGNQLLCSDRAAFSKNCAKKSRHNAVTVRDHEPTLSAWKVKAFNPQFRMELEYTDVPANQPVVITHRTTNQNLCLESEHTVRTAFGMEYEVSGFTKLNSHKAEENINHWRIQCIVPGDESSPQQ